MLFSLSDTLQIKLEDFANTYNIFSVRIEGGSWVGCQIAHWLFQIHYLGEA